MDSEMAPELWSGLPADILRRVLSFLSVPVLCRFQTVCKRWNSRIRSDQFRALCIKNAKEQRFILGRCAATLVPGKAHFSRSLGWRLLDVKAKRWYFIEQDEDDSYDSYESRSLAVDGGLVCAYYLDPVAILNDRVKVCVSNPIAKAYASLPASPYDGLTTSPCMGQLLLDPMYRRVPAVMSMAVEHGHNFARFKIFVMHCALRENSLTPSIFVYDSTTSSWGQSSANLARLTAIRNTESLAVRCMVFFDGFLYVLISKMNPYDDWFWQLWRFNPESEDAWKNTGAKSRFPSLLLHPQLVVSGNRLFLVPRVTRALELPPANVSTFDLVEMLLEEGNCRPVVQIPESQMERVFMTDFHEQTVESRQLADVNPYCFATSPDVTAIGFEKSLVLMAKKSGVSVEFDLMTGTWSDKRPFEALPCYHELWYGQPMNLSLHSTTMLSHLRKRQQPGLVYLSDSSSDNDDSP